MKRHPGYWSHAVRSQKGFGILEILLGVAIIAGLATATVIYSGAVKKASRVTYTDRFNCTGHVTSFLSKVRAVAGSTSIVSFHAFGANRTPGNMPNYSPLWSYSPTGVPQYLSNQSQPLANSAPVIRGIVGMLNTMYNASAPDFCGNFRSTGDIQEMAGQTAESLGKPGGANPTTSMRIRMYDLTTGAVLTACPRPLWVGPAGLSETDARRNGIAAGIFRRDATFRNNVGFLVEVRTQYTDESGAAQTCETSQRFSYERDTQPPPAPVVQVLNMVTPAPGSTAHRNQFQVSISYQAGLERGVVLACRDRSTATQLAPTYPCYAVTGGVGVGPGPQPRPDQSTPTVSVPAVGEIVASQHGANRGSWGAVANSGWGPCESVRACGSAPTSTASFDANGAITIVNSYANARSHCIIRVEAAIMDASGNLNASVVSGNYYPVQISSAPSNNTITARPTCGSWCNYYPSNPYWQVGGCCLNSLSCSAGRVGTPSGPRRYLSYDPDTPTF